MLLNEIQLDWRFIDAADYEMLTYFWHVPGGHSPKDLMLMYCSGGEL